jgi:hypothetical protein
MVDCYETFSRTRGNSPQFAVKTPARDHKQWYFRVPSARAVIDAAQHGCSAKYFSQN